MDCRNCINKLCYINKNCNPSWLEYVESHKTRKYYSAESLVFSAGDIVAGIYVICSGGAKIIMNNSEEGKRIIRFGGKGQVLGHRGLSSEMVYSVSAITIENTELAYIPNEVFFKLLKENPDLSFYMLLFFADELAQSEKRFKLESMAYVNQKVGFGLCLLIDAFGYEEGTNKIIDYRFDLNDFSIFVDVKPQVLKKEIERLATHKIISQENKSIRIINENELRSCASNIKTV